MRQSYLQRCGPFSCRPTENRYRTQPGNRRGALRNLSRHRHRRQWTRALTPGCPRIRELSVSRATFYRLLARFRASEVTSAVLPEQSGRKNGSHFLDARREAIHQLALKCCTWRQEDFRPLVLSLNKYIQESHVNCQRETQNSRQSQVRCRKLPLPGNSQR